MSQITQEILKNLFSYTKDGFFIRKTTRGAYKKGQKVLGTQHYLGYKFLKVKNKMVFYHRAIFLWHHGYLPKYLDHINRIRIDNRIENLRPASAVLNGANKGLPKNNKSGYSGLYWNKIDKSWVGAVMFNGKRKKLGQSRDKEEIIKRINKEREAIRAKLKI